MNYKRPRASVLIFNYKPSAWLITNVDSNSLMCVGVSVYYNLNTWSVKMTPHTCLLTGYIETLGLKRASASFTTLQFGMAKGAGQGEQFSCCRLQPGAHIMCIDRYAWVGGGGGGGGAGENTSVTEIVEIT